MDFCSSGKKVYGTQERAEKIADDEFQWDRAPLYVYKCKECFKWHLTSKKPNVTFKKTKNK